MKAGSKLSANQGDAREMLKQLDVFLDDRAEEDREAMESVVAWFERTGDLEPQIRASVAAVSALFQKWSFEIMFLLRLRGTMRFNQLKEELSSVGPPTIGKKVADLAGVGSRTLSQRLKELEARGMIDRNVYPEVPVRVEYSLTPRGMRFGDLIMPVIAHLRITEPRGGN